MIAFPFDMLHIPAIAAAATGIAEAARSQASFSEAYQKLLTERLVQHVVACQFPWYRETYEDGNTIRWVRMPYDHTIA